MKTDKEVIEVIKRAEEKKQGIMKLFPSRVNYFQKTTDFDKKNVGVIFDKEFDLFVIEMQDAIGGVIYQKKKKKIINNWFQWAIKQ